MAIGMFVVPICAWTGARGQFSLEQVYANASGSTMPGFMFHDQLFLVELEASGWKYVRIDRDARSVDLFNLDHSPWRTVSFSMTDLLNPYVGSQDVLYISQHLFDLDDGVEFLYTNSFSPGNGPPSGVTQVVDEETEGLIFDVDDQIPVVRPNFHMQQYPIRTTPAGTKLILSGMLNDSAYVYGVPGDLAAGMSPFAGPAESEWPMGLFPNPTSAELAVVLPSGFVNARLTLFAADGRVVRETSVTASTMTIDVSSLPAGRYTCKAVNTFGRSCTGGFIKD